MSKKRFLEKGDRTPGLMDEISSQNAHLISKSIAKLSKSKRQSKGKKMNFKNW